MHTLGLRLRSDTEGQQMSSFDTTSIVGPLRMTFDWIQAFLWLVFACPQFIGGPPTNLKPKAQLCRRALVTQTHKHGLMKGFASIFSERGLYSTTTFIYSILFVAITFRVYTPVLKFSIFSMPPLTLPSRICLPSTSYSS